MRNIGIAILALFATVLFAACESNDTESQVLPSEGYSTLQFSESDTVPGQSIERLVYKSRDEFYEEITAANRSSEKNEETEFHNLGSVAQYYDFQNVIEDVTLDEIYVTSNSIALSYLDKNGEEPEALLIEWLRADNVDEEVFLENRRASDTVDIIVNGHKALKQEVYWDNEIWDNEYMCNQYYWVENGNAIFLRIPPWLLERYPEEIFFDIAAVKVP